jgi:hypothetical protein
VKDCLYGRVAGAFDLSAEAFMEIRPAESVTLNLLLETSRNIMEHEPEDEVSFVDSEVMRNIRWACLAWISKTSRRAKARSISFFPFFFSFVVKSTTTLVT